MSRAGKIALYAVGGLAGIVVLSAAGLYASSESKVNKEYDVPIVEYPIPTDSASIQRGKHLATAIAKCTECHAVDMGGGTIMDDPSIGVLSSSNVTRGGVGAEYTDAELIRAIRHGVKRNGLSVLIMPSEDWQYMTDEDVTAIVAYIRSLPPITRELKPFQLGPLGTALVGSGITPIAKAELVDHSYVPPKTIAVDTTPEYGKYLANVGGCVGCHGPGFSGGPPSAPPAANITPTGIGHYTDEQVETILRTGQRPDGTTVGDYMPWRSTALMTSIEMRATIKFLRTVQPKEFGNR